jgi:adenylate cyclase
MWISRNRSRPDELALSVPPARKPGRVPFAYVALGLIASLVIILAAALIWFNFTQSRGNALAAGDDLLNQIAGKIHQRTRTVFDPLLVLAETVVLLPDIDRLPDFAPHPVTPFLVSAIEQHPQIQSAYLGFANGDFLMVSSIRETDDGIRAALDAPDEARFAIQVVRRSGDGRRIAFWSFWDVKRRLIGSKAPYEGAFDPRQRPWYRDAMAKPDPIVTDYYVFFTSGEVGVTVANSFDGEVPGVFGIDLDLTQVSDFLAEQLELELTTRLGDSGALAALFTKSGRIVAVDGHASAAVPAAAQRSRDELPTIGETRNEVLKALYGKLAGDGFPQDAKVAFAAGGKNYIARAAAIPERYGRDTMLAIAVPSDAFLSPYLDVRTDALLISIVLVLVFVPVILEAVRRISRPLRQLTRSAAMINNFDLDQPVDVSSFIKEIDELSATIRNMRSTLTSFSKYVPKSLVRNIVQSNMVPELGGERRDISVMFSDIQDFTPMSQAVEPEELMNKLSEYLHGVVEIIIEHHGVVDKFVGDAVMAYWNAPEADPDHIRNSCVAALRCKAWTNAKNSEWMAAGGIPYYTRFGLHTGTSIVGNVGSSDRMDYTVMGAPINLGARLEALNKFYGTQILVSEAVQSANRGAFLFRHLDHALPKGALEPIQLFELVGALPGTEGVPPEIVATDADRVRCERWRPVITEYEAREWTTAAVRLTAFLDDYPGDTIANLYLNRAKKYIANPPPPDWDGVEVYLTKR